MITRHHRGSALLVVLGMIAFMVVSAVAFSAYMRYSRLPSSFLRQTSSSRLLIKAALANAIDEVDAAIGNNPHPGVGTMATQYPRDAGSSFQRNFWVGRVFFGTNCTQAVAVNETVTPLCFEALAYLPPPLVNEVRYYSRHTPSAAWHRMNFDAGRYAYCAVDVSDYLDVNVLSAGGPRSSEPDSKISLAYLFENADHSSASGGLLGSADTWDSFMDNYRGDSKIPLISLADWNLAFSKNSGPFQTPFCKYVENGTDNFYGLSSDDDDDAEKIRQQTFVTDSYFPSETTTTGDNAVFDLTDDLNQPWTESELSSWRANACESVASGESKCLTRLLDHMPFAACVALYDYLDYDRVPSSLALPTVERVPMVCALEVTYNEAALAVKDTVDAAQQYQYDPKDYEKSPSRVTTKKLQYNLNGDKLKLADLQVNGYAVYPFRHHDAVSSSGFTVDGVAMLYLTSGDMGLRANQAIERLKALDENVYKTASVGDGVITLPLSSQSLSLPSSDIDNPQDAVVPFTLQVDAGSAAANLEKVDNVLLSAVLKLTQTADPIDPQDLSKGYNWANPKPCQNEEIEDNEQATVESAECKFRPLTDQGATDENYAKTGSDLFTLFRKGGASLRLNVAVVVRVLYTDEKAGKKVVDMVPATGACDETFNRNENGSGLAKEGIATVSGDWTQGEIPLLRLDTGASFIWGRKGFQESVKTPSTIAVTPKSMMIGDPRYNYAPESWFRYEGELSEQTWVDNCGARNADGDIFLQVSDQCRLQSVYELANLPRIGSDGLLSPGDTFQGQLDLPAAASARKSIGTENQALNRNFMWKTYDPFGRYRSDDNGDGFERLRLVSNGGGFKINPYSDSTNILMAAFANTPHDWRCAYYDNKGIQNIDMAASAFNAKYAWNQYSSGAKLYWDDLEEVAGEFMAEVRASSPSDWEETWEVALRNLGWQTAAKGGTSEENAKYILDGLDLDGGCKVFNTDRKFLYGYWHDCLAARQQLFLIFVRVEPVMMGGGAIGQTPPQLGARAVALVWRDPRSTSDSRAPHRTRVLFYRQFD